MTRTASAQTAPPATQQIDLDAVARVLEEKRHWLWIDLPSRRITADATDPQPDIAVLEITNGGMRIATVEPMPVGALFFMHLTLNDGRRIQAPAIVTRCTWFGGDVSGHLLTLKF